MLRILKECTFVFKVMQRVMRVKVTYLVKDLGMNMKVMKGLVVEVVTNLQRIKLKQKNLNFQLYYYHQRPSGCSHLWMFSYYLVWLIL